MNDDRPEIDLDALRSLERDLPADDVFELLSDRYVRYALYYLSEQSTATLGQLTDVVTGLETTRTDAVASPADRERVRVRLYHVVLPELGAVGYVDFDAEDLTVTETNVPPGVYSLLGIDD